MHRQLLLILTLIALGMAATTALAETLELTPARDNTLFEDAEGRFSNGGGKHLFIGRVGEDGQGELRRTVIAFDLTTIPPNAIIDSARLEVTIVQTPDQTRPDGMPVDDSSSLHRVLSDWGEGFSNAPGAEGRGTRVEPLDPPGAPIDVGAVTWIHTFFDPDPGSATFWASPGGDFEPLESASTPFTTANPETIVFGSTAKMIADVQSWVANPAENFGWLLKGDEVRLRNARGLASREHPDEAVPRLVVDYTIPSVTDDLSLTEVNGALSNPVGLAHAGDGSGRLFIVEQQGAIRIFDTAAGVLLPVPFLAIEDEVFSLDDPGGGNEQGLLGLAFHPDYATNGLFYVNYTIQDGPYYTVIAEHSVSPDPNKAVETGVIIMKFEQEARNHNGGDMHFGTDGYLYIASGDGGGGDDQYNNAQDVDTLRGALLRIDVDSVAPGGAELCSTAVGNYGIPPNNAFPGATDGCDELLHIGLRNPWRFSFDAQTGDLLIADVGQGDWEEVNRVAGTSSGLNFGWPCREGQHDFPDGPDGVVCPPPLTEPVLEYGHVDGNCSVTGGYVYRGNSLPLSGLYIYGDWCSRRIWITGEADGWNALEWEGTPGILNSLSSFGQDEKCELYVTDRSAGKLFRIDDGQIVFKDGLEQSKCQ